MGLRHAVLVDQDGGLALRRHQAGHGHLLAQAIKDKGGIRHQFHHVIDIVPTILEAAQLKQPEVVDGIPQKPIEGVSMAYTFDKKNADAASTHKTQYFEMIGDRAIYHDGWIASTKVMRVPWDNSGKGHHDPASWPWELYDLSKDWTQYEDVAAKYPEKAEGAGGAVLEGSGEETRSCR